RLRTPRQRTRLLLGGLRLLGLRGHRFAQVRDLVFRQLPEVDLPALGLRGDPLERLPPLRLLRRRGWAGEVERDEEQPATADRAPPAPRPLFLVDGLARQGDTNGTGTAAPPPAAFPLGACESCSSGGAPFFRQGGLFLCSTLPSRSSSSLHSTSSSHTCSMSPA